LFGGWNIQVLAAAVPEAAGDSRLLNDPEIKRQALRQRRRQQFEKAKSWRVFHQFRFADKFFSRDIYFTTQLATNRLYLNRGKGRFEDITERAGVGLVDQVVVTASFADVDNDGLPDLFATTVRHGNRLFKNLGGGRFDDITKPAGLGYVGHSSGAVFFDYDNDGRLDLFVCNIGRYTTEELGRSGYYLGFTNGFSGHLFLDRAEPCILYRNLGGNKFANVTQATGLERAPNWSGDATFTDLNGDGSADLYVLSMQGDDRYFENQAGKRFVEKVAAYFPRSPWGAMGVKFFDFNRDGLMDLFVTDMHSDMTGLQTRISLRDFTVAFEKQKSEQWCSAENGETYYQGMSNNIFGNAVYLNRGPGRFEEVSDQIGAETFWPWGISVGDFNADGYEDAFVAGGMGYGFRYGVNSLLLNDSGRRFVDAEFVLGVEPRAEAKISKVAFVLDCSGADKDHIGCRGQSGKVTIFESLSTRSSVVFDLDNDGDLDIVTNEMNDRPQVLVSDLANGRGIKFLKVKFVGTTANRDGLGALVRVFAGKTILTQFHDGKSGHLSQSSMPLHFGLGEAASVDRIEVTWPSGKKPSLQKGIGSNRLVTIKESENSSVAGSAVRSRLRA
jgi:hypothetical protein